MGNGQIVHTALLLRIEKAIPTLCKSEQIVASYIIKNVNDISSLSVASIADSCGVSDPTVVRTCQKLGFTGYHSLKLAITQSINSPENSRLDAVKSNDDLQSITEKIFQSCMHTLQFTLETIDLGDLESVAQMLIHSEKIIILSNGSSTASAELLQRRLFSLKSDIYLCTDPYTQLEACNRAGAKDVVFAICCSGRLKSIVDCVQIAKDACAKIITLTNSGRSPLSKIANTSLFTTICETGIENTSSVSQVAELSIIDTVCTYIATRKLELDNLSTPKGLSNLEY